jgi:uncharacterized hydrophobic protein (TIGR00341 family)
MRLLEIIIEDRASIDVDDLLNHDEVIDHWTYKPEHGQTAIKVLVQDAHARDLLSALEEKSIHRVVIYPIEGTLPKVETKLETQEEKFKLGKFVAISKEELYHDVDVPVSFSMNFVLMVVLSSFVAGIGILKNNIAIIIGAMVIAPFLGPNMSMAFGTTLGDLQIIRKSIITGVAATLIALVISMIWGYTATDISTIAYDPDIEYQDILLALICGFSGAVSVISGQGSTLVGVMVAAALLPPLMRAGLLLGGGEFGSALNSLLIFGANIICLNIAGIITFYLSGIRPGRWWDKEEAKRKTRTAFIVWTIALLILIVAIMVIEQFK